MTLPVIARTAMVFLAALAAGGLLVVQQERLESAERRRAATERARAAADAIQLQLEGSLAAPYALAAAVRQAGGVHDFERYAGELLGVFGGIDSLQLAPGGVLRHIHPLAGNEAALGLDVLGSPIQRGDALRAIETRRLVLAGPFTLRQGGVGFAARVPVFVKGGDGEERFWGIASAIFALPRLLHAAHVERLSEAGYEYALRKTAGPGGELVAASVGAAGMRAPVVAQIHLPNDAWTLAIAPRRGWGPGTWTYARSGAALALALALALLASRVFRLPEALARQVAERTAALQRASAEREALLQGIPDPAWLKDREGRFVATNEALAHLAGRSRDALVGRTHSECFGGPEVVEVEAHDAQVAATGEQLVTAERVQVGGAVVVFEVVKRPFLDETGAVIGTLGIARDVTERTRLEARERQADKMEAIGRLAGGLAHDFNNILTVVLGSASELRRRVADPVARELADEVLEGGQRAAALTRQLLAFGRKQPLRLEDVDVNEVVRGFERMLRRILPEDVAIELRLDADAAIVHADAGQLEQVLLNLVVNARDAMPAGGRIAIETALAARAPVECGLDAVPCVVLAVRDDGAGMDAAVRAHLFEPFFTTKAAGRGTGLGLATVFGIVKQSGGGVAVETAPGAGSTFRVYLPQVEPSPEAVVPRTTRA